MKKFISPRAALSTLVIGAVLFSAKPLLSAEKEKENHDLSVAYFNKMSLVLQHPRCLNCHPKGDYPLVGMEMKPHPMNVQRGPHNEGFVGMKCATCHGEENNLNSGLPGAPGWELAPKTMAWVGKSRREICLAMKDKKKNGGMPLEALPIHNGQNQLVGWAWHPGPGREPAPGTQKEFGELTQKWIETGAACPE